MDNTTKLSIQSDIQDILNGKIQLKISKETINETLNFLIFNFKDPAYTMRKDFLSHYDIQSSSITDDMYKHIFMKRYKLDSDKDIDIYFKDAIKYISKLRFNIFNELIHMKAQELIELMNNESYANDFLKKYTLPKEEYKNDKFLQCFECVQ